MNTVVAFPPTVSPHSGTLRSLFASAKWRLMLTYALFNLENLLRLAQPFVLGWAINDLLTGAYQGLLAFVAQHLGHLAIGTWRQMYDTRVFTGLYTDLATGLVSEQRGQGVDVSRVAARSSLSREFVEFFERHVPLVVRSAYSIVGAMVMLAWYDWLLVPLCGLLIVPVCLLNLRYSRQTHRLSRQLHDELEREVNAIDEGSPAAVRGHFSRVAGWRVKLSNAEAVNFGLTELFVLGLMAAVLIRFCSAAAVSPGDIFAVFRYVLMFVMGLDSVPHVVQHVSRLRDIRQRLSGNGSPVD